MIKCDFCNLPTDEQFIYKLYTRIRTGNTTTTKHIHICEMDFEAIKKYDEELDVFYIDRTDARYYFYSDLDVVDECGFNTNNLLALETKKEVLHQYSVFICLNVDAGSKAEALEIAEKSLETIGNPEGLKNWTHYEVEEV